MPHAKPSPVNACGRIQEGRAMTDAKELLSEERIEQIEEGRAPRTESVLRCSKKHGGGGGT